MMRTLFLIGGIISLFFLMSCGDDTKHQQQKEQLALQNPVVAPYTKMIQKDSSSSEAYFLRAQALANIESDTLAVSDFEKAIQLDQHNISYKMTFAHFLYEIKAYSKAAEQYELVLELQPQHEDALLSVIQAYIQIQDAASARKHLSEPLNQVPNHPVLRYLDAEIKLIEKDTTTALQIVDRLMKEEPRLYAAHFLKGEILAARDDEACVQYFEKAFSLDTLDLLPLEEIGDFYLARNDFDHALKYYKETVIKDNAYAYGFYKSGLTYEMMDSLDKAKNSYLIAVKTDLKFYRAYLALASLYEKQNQKDSAIKYYQLTLTFNQNNEAAASGLKRMEKK